MLPTKQQTNRDKVKKKYSYYQDTLHIYVYIWSEIFAVFLNSIYKIFSSIRILLLAKHQYCALKFLHINKVFLKHRTYNNIKFHRFIRLFMRIRNKIFFSNTTIKVLEIMHIFFYHSFHLLLHSVNNEITVRLRVFNEQP